MTRSEIAKAFDVTPKTIYEWQKRGLPKTKMMIGGLKWRWDFDKKAVKQWLAEQEKGK